MRIKLFRKGVKCLSTSIVMGIPIVSSTPLTTSTVFATEDIEHVSVEKTSV